MDPTWMGFEFSLLSFTQEASTQKRRGVGYGFLGVEEVSEEWAGSPESRRTSRKALFVHTMWGFEIGICNFWTC